LGNALLNAAATAKIMHAIVQRLHRLFKHFLMRIVNKSTYQAIAILCCIIIYGLTAAFTKSHIKKSEYQSPGSRLNAKDLQFLVDAGYGNLDEIDAGSLAPAKSSTESIRSFSEMMVEDHRMAENELRTIAENVKTPIPKEPDSPHIMIKQTLSQLPAAVFDTAWLRQQITDHMTAVALFQSEIHNGKDTSVKEYADKYLPKVKMHLAIADSLLQELQDH
jgi:putative membrane protein